MYQYKYCPQCGRELQEGQIEGKNRQHCNHCGFVYYINPKPAVGIIAVQDNKVVLIKRGVDPGKGQWSLPSGFIDVDETPEEAGLRELNEETGLAGEVRQLIGVYSQQAQVYGPVMVVFFLVDMLSGEMKAADDALEVKLMEIEQVKDLHFACFNLAFQEARRILKGEKE